jgi:hypothetical protein
MRAEAHTYLERRPPSKLACATRISHLTSSRMAWSDSEDMRRTACIAFLTMMNSVAFPKLALIKPPRASPVYLGIVSVSNEGGSPCRDKTYKATASVPKPSIPASGTTPINATAKTTCTMSVIDSSRCNGLLGNIRPEFGRCNAVPMLWGCTQGAHSTMTT